MKKKPTDETLEKEIYEQGRKRAQKVLTRRELVGEEPRPVRDYSAYVPVSTYVPLCTIPCEEKPKQDENTLTIDFSKFRKQCQQHNTWFMSCTVKVCRPQICPFWKAMSK